LSPRVRLLADVVHIHQQHSLDPKAGTYSTVPSRGVWAAEDRFDLGTEVRV